MESGPKIQPVKDPTEVDDRFKDIHPHLPQISGYGGGACVLLLAPIKCGKSTIISNLLLNTDFYDAQNNFDDTYVISNTIANDTTSRFLKDAFDVYDSYDDRTVSDIINYQKGFDKTDQPQCAIVIDDCLGSIKREAKVNHLASRFRHYGIRLLIFSSQKFTGSVSPIIRANATNVIVGSPFPNRRELGKIAEEYGDLFGGQDQFLKLYQYATPDRYNFIHLDIQSNPPLMYKNFDEVIAVGEKSMVPLNGIKSDLFENKNKNIVEQ